MVEKKTGILRFNLSIARMNSTLDREQQITEILSRRHPLANRLYKIEQNLAALSTAIDIMVAKRNDLVQQVGNEVTQQRLMHVDLDRIKNAVAIELQNVSRYHSRFSRSTLNIGVIGLARQGKSQLLRSLSGLADDSIPAGRYGHCTGTRSMIVHNPSVEAHGEIFFFTEREFVQDVLAAYYGDSLGLTPQPLSIKEFEYNSLPDLPLEKQDSLSAKLKYDHLNLYKEKLPEYKPLLMHVSPQSVPIEQVREYVAQDDALGQRVYNNFLAVKEARVICKFPHNNLGRIALVDMPGLGDTGLGAERRLIHTLGHDVDIILFVKKPSGLGAVWDKQEIELYDTARGALPELPLELWSFLVMNHVRSTSPNEDNLENCNRLLAEKSEKMQFAGTFIADCSNSEEANNIVFQKLLDYLTENIEYIDSQYIKSCEERLNALNQQISAEMSKAQAVFGIAANPTDADFNLFHQLYEITEKRRFSGLEERIKELREQRDEPNETFYENVLNAKAKCYEDTGIPSLIQIEETRNLLGGYKLACDYYLHFVRTHLTHHFESLDGGLVDSVEAIKTELAEVLKNDNQGRLSLLCNKSGAEFFREMSLLLQDHSKVLYPAFAVFAEFQLSYQGLLYYRLRKHLDCLTPDAGQAEISSNPTSREVQDILVAMQKIALEGLRGELDDWPIEINQAIFAIAEQFVDKILRSEHAGQEWRSFYMTNRTRIWPDHFKQLTIDDSLNRLWKEVTEKVISLNKSIMFTNN